MTEAKEFVERVQARLDEPDLRDDPSYDNHRRLLTCAHASSNGSGGDVAILSQTVATLSATYVQDRVRDSDRLPKAIADAAAAAASLAVSQHVNSCPAAKSKGLSCLRFTVAGQTVDANGPAAFVLAVALAFFGMRYYGSKTASDLRAELAPVLSTVVTGSVDKQAP